MTDWLWLVPLMPLLGALLNGVVLRGRLSKQGVTMVACGSVLLSFLIGMSAAISYLGSGSDAPFVQTLYEWIPAGGGLSFDMGFQLDPLSCVMLFVVTFVGFLIHVYSVRYFTYLNLFMGAMLLLILGNNYLVMFVGWEGVGLCSYLLIGFYYDQEFPPYAGRKAFIVNRIGDFAFLIGMFALVAEFGTLSYTELFGAIAADPHAGRRQLRPRHDLRRLRDALPVHRRDGQERADSALRLAAGRDGRPDAGLGADPRGDHGHRRRLHGRALERALPAGAGHLGVVAVDRRATALFAATIGLAQTRHQEGPGLLDGLAARLHVPGRGVGAYGGDLPRLMTHAFFKALLFLGSGSVIHAMGGEQDMRKMGGLRSACRWTYKTFLDRDRSRSPVSRRWPGSSPRTRSWPPPGPDACRRWLWAIGLADRGADGLLHVPAVFMTFHGDFRGTDTRAHLHESPKVMTIPLMVLAVGLDLRRLPGDPEARQARHGTSSGTSSSR